MYYYIKGTVALIEPNMVVIDAGGVGYQLMTSMRSASAVKIGENAKFYTYLNVREDAMELFGFCNQEELSCFKNLISVSGVGPKAALSILSVLDPQKLALAIVTGDVTALTKAQGVGKKIAQRIAMELKDKMSAEPGETDIAAPASADEGTVKDALDALVVLGYPRSRVLSALRDTDTAGMAVDEIVRAALKKLY